MRASLYIMGDAGERLVIDTGPEFRLQAVRAGITRLDAVLLTHPHADHLHGLDDIRSLTWESPIPVYGNQLTIEELKERFSYIFRQTQPGGGKPRILPGVVTQALNIGRLTAAPIPVKHGALDILGWKITEEGTPGAAVYLTDVSAVPARSRVLINRPEVLIIGALRVEPHPTHFSFNEALETAADIQARRVYLTHLAHNNSHVTIEEYCRKFQEKRGLKSVFMGPAYDGLELELKPSS
jgi:phosphoribosyl 1,2-cyclic phosphate phosphodiesterase